MHTAASLANAGDVPAPMRRTLPSRNPSVLQLAVCLDYRVIHPVRTDRVTPSLTLMPSLLPRLSVYLCAAAAAADSSCGDSSSTAQFQARLVRKAGAAAVSLAPQLAAVARPAAQHSAMLQLLGEQPNRLSQLAEPHALAVPWWIGGSESARDRSFAHVRTKHPIAGTPWAR